MCDVGRVPPVPAASLAVVAECSGCGEPWVLDAWKCPDCEPKPKVGRSTPPPTQAYIAANAHADLRLAVEMAKPLLRMGRYAEALRALESADV